MHVITTLNKTPLKMVDDLTNILDHTSPHHKKTSKLGREWLGQHAIAFIKSGLPNLVHTLK